MSDREKLRLIYEKLIELKTYRYEDLRRRQLYITLKEIYEIIIERKEKLK